MLSIEQLARNVGREHKAAAATNKILEQIKGAETNIVRYKAKIAFCRVVGEKWGVLINPDNVAAIWDWDGGFKRVKMGLDLWPGVGLIMINGGIDSGTMGWYDPHNAKWQLSIDGANHGQFPFGDFPAAVAAAFALYRSSNPAPEAGPEPGTGAGADFAFDADREIAWAARPKGRD